MQRVHTFSGLNGNGGRLLCQALDGTLTISQSNSSGGPLQSPMMDIVSKWSQPVSFTPLEVNVACRFTINKAAHTFVVHDFGDSVKDPK